MELIDFLKDEKLNELRQKMEALEYGHFVSFDPERHLMQSELELLSEGIEMDISDVHRQPDRTLSYKNSRVWIISGGELHLANCEKVKKLRNAEARVVISNQYIPKDLPVCPQCLLELQYQGLDTRRMRRVDYIEQLVKEFSMDEYYKRYPIHPLP